MLWRGRRDGFARQTRTLAWSWLRTRKPMIRLNVISLQTTLRTFGTKRSPRKRRTAIILVLVRRRLIICMLSLRRVCFRVRVRRYIARFAVQGRSITRWRSLHQRPRMEVPGQIGRWCAAAVTGSLLSTAYARPLRRCRSPGKSRSIGRGRSRGPHGSLHLRRTVSLFSPTRS